MAYLQMKTYSETLRTKTEVNVILPTPLTSLTKETVSFPYYDRSNNIPVLYLFHGTFGEAADWMRFSMIETFAQDYNIAVVMPSVGNSCFRDMPRGGPKYYTYVTEELPKIINWTFPVSTKREDTFIAGLSMGGSGAFKVGMSRPDQYGYVASLSGGFGEIYKRLEADSESPWSLAFEPGVDTRGTRDDFYWLASQVVSKADCPRFYMCCGTEDFVYPANCEFRKHLDSIGFKYDYHETPGDHNWMYWNDEIQRVFEWLPIKKRADYK